MPDCLFCQIGEHGADNSHPENLILLESDRFYVKPALGHFVEGYCLIVTKDHLSTMAELDLDDYTELEDMLTELSQRFRELYGPGLCVFEHGAACPSNRAGACIDHAHIHVLPIHCDVTGRLSALPATQLSATSELRNFATGSESYIYYEPEPGRRLAYTFSDRLPSQFMRRLICEQLPGMDWDWRASPYCEQIHFFLARWRRAFPPAATAALSACAST